MASPDRTAQDETLTRCFAEAGVQDLRDAYRSLLRALRAEDPAGFAKASRHYEEQVLPRIASDTDPLDAWIEYGALLCELRGAGRLLAIDRTGRGAPYRPPYEPGLMLLFAPEDTNQAMTATVVPREPSLAQQATLGLLVERRLSL